MKEIELTQGKVALVNDEDFKRVNQFKWCANYIGEYWYAVRNIRKPNGKYITQLMHRVIMACPKGLETDHRNHNGVDNRKCNLRICTHGENQRNRQPLQKCTSKYKGVYWHKASKKWCGRIKINKKSIHLGLYTNEITAALAYNVKAKELFGEFAYLNFQ